MRIDTHQHYWRYQAQDYGWISDAMPTLQRDCLPPDVLPAMQAAGVTTSIAVQARSSAQETEALLNLAAQHACIAGVVGWVDLAAPDLEAQLDRWAGRSALVGFRHILQDEPDVAGWVADAGVNAGLRQLQVQRLTYDVLVYQRQLPVVQNFCARHDRHWLVLDHLGKPALGEWAADDSGWQQWRRAMEDLARLPHVAVKLSGLVTETAWGRQAALSEADRSRMHDCCDRLLFGSDWPVCQLAAPYDAVTGLIAAWSATRLSASEQAALWFGNAQRIYDLMG